MNDYCKVRFSGESNDGTGEVPNTLRVKDSAGPCDCIKDSDGSQPIKKTQIDSTLNANLNSLCVLECVDASKCK